MERTRPSAPREVRLLADATRIYMSVLRDALPGLEQQADVVRLREPAWSALVDEIRAAQRPFPRLNGAPAAIGEIIAELLGEV